MTRNPGYDSEVGHRIVEDLRAAWLCEKPPSIPASRPRGVKRTGITYEKNFGKALSLAFKFDKVIPGQWFHFSDTNGFGYCQTDWLVICPLEIFIFECKLTDTEKGRSQINRLYRPVVEQVFKLPTRGIVVTRHLTKETELALVCDQLAAARSFNFGVVPTLHWRERAPL